MQVNLFRLTTTFMAMAVIATLAIFSAGAFLRAAMAIFLGFASAVGLVSAFAIDTMAFFFSKICR
jgi:hypothetical protein